MEGHSAVPKFDPFVEPSTLGPRWTRWLSGFELFADGKELIIEQLLAGATAESVQRQHVVRQRRRALLLHSAGPDVQDIFLTLTDTGERREYDVAVTALNFCRQKRHLGAQGQVGTKQSLRSKVWWPGIDKAVETYCRSCHGCQLVARPDAPEPIRSTTLPVGPWIDVGVDLLGPLPSGHSILVVVD